jgi:hypothetical protein
LTKICDNMEYVRSGFINHIPQRVWSSMAPIWEGVIQPYGKPISDCVGPVFLHPPKFHISSFKNVDLAADQGLGHKAEKLSDLNYIKGNCN